MEGRGVRFTRVGAVVGAAVGSSAVAVAGTDVNVGDFTVSVTVGSGWLTSTICKVAVAVSGRAATGSAAEQAANPKRTGRRSNRDTDIVLFILITYIAA